MILYVDAKSIERNEAYESFSAACLDMRVSRSQNLNSFGALDITGKPVLGFLAIQGERRKFRHAPFLDFGDDEMMSWRLLDFHRGGLEVLQRGYNAGLRHTRTTRYGR